METRRCWQSGRLGWFADRDKWEGLRSVGVVESVWQVGLEEPNGARVQGSELWHHGGVGMPTEAARIYPDNSSSPDDFAVCNGQRQDDGSPQSQPHLPALLFERLGLSNFMRPIAESPG